MKVEHKKFLTKFLYSIYINNETGDKMSETVTLGDIHNDLEFLKKKVLMIEQEIITLRDIEPEVQDDYLKKLKRIEMTKGKTFDNKEEFLRYLENEL